MNNSLVKRNPFCQTKNEDRILLAKEKTSFLVDELGYLSQIHENNAVVVFSDTISKQIRLPRAACAFEALKRAMFEYEIIVLCRIWDSIDTQKSSIPTIMDLINETEVIQQLANEKASFWFDEPKYGKAKGELTKERLNCAIRSAKEIVDSSLLRGIMNTRNKHLAHSLASTRTEKTGPISLMKYGQQTELLNKTFAIAEALHSGINHTSFSFEESQNMHKRQSNALWQGIKINVLE